MTAPVLIAAGLHGDAGFKVRLPQQKMLIGQSWEAAADGRVIDVEDPATGKVFAAVPAGTAADVDRAVRAARTAFESAAWSRMRPLDRGRIIEAIARKIEDHSQELALLESYDNGKAVHHALAVDVPAAVDIFRYMAGWASKIYGQVNPISGDGRQYHSYSVREPIGVVGQIVPWNYPLAMAAWKIASALAAGCTIVLKPSEVTPLTALRLAELALEAGLPDGVLNIVTGYGHEAGQALVEHPGIDKIAFTGSTRVGKRIVQTCAKDLKRVTLELGGNDAAIVLDDVDVADAAAKVFHGAMLNAGQICVAIKRAYVPTSIYDRFCEELARMAEEMVVDDGAQQGAEIGPVQNRAQFEKVKEFLADAAANGKVIAGGSALDRPGYFIAPTIVRDIDRNARIVREEQFGPVLPVLAYDDVDALIDEVNDSPYGLAGTVWSKDRARATEIAMQIDSGTVWVNQHMAIDPEIPFRGAKQSGLGGELGQAGLHEYTQAHIVNIAA